MDKLSFVIPCYKSSKMISSVIGRIIQTVKNDGRYAYEIICVNDCSPDDTFLTLKALAENRPQMKVINLARNFGQHAALMAGFHYVTGDIVVCLDDDGQNPPEQVFKLIDKLNEGYDYVAAKYETHHSSMFRRFGTMISYSMTEFLLGKPKNVEMNSYFAVRRFVIDEVIRYRNAYPFIAGLILRVTRNITSVYVDHDKRIQGTSGYSFIKLLGLWMNGFTAFSEKPLRLASVFGFIAAAGGFIFGIWTIIKKIINPAVPMGYSSLMAVLLFTIGINMLFLGLVGEYIGRIYISINNAPQYVVREVVNCEVKEDEAGKTANA